MPNYNDTEDMPSVVWHCWLGIRKSIWLVKIKSWGVGVVICLERGADCLHMVQLMPLHPKTPSSLASFKSRLVLPFWYRLAQVVLEKRPLSGCSSSSSSSSTSTKIVKKQRQNTRPRSNEQYDERQPGGDQVQQHDRTAHDEPGSKVDPRLASVTTHKQYIAA